MTRTLPLLALVALVAAGCHDNCTPLANQAQQIISQPQTCQMNSDCVLVLGGCGFPAQRGVALTTQNASTFTALANQWDFNGCGQNACHTCPPRYGAACSSNNACVLTTP